MADFRTEWLKWRRAVNASRREVAKALKALGFEVADWTKRDKGRTIIQVFGTGTLFEQALDRALVAANQKYAAKLVLSGQLTVITKSKCDYEGGLSGYTLILGS
jgi:hypothetical protein